MKRIAKTKVTKSSLTTVPKAVKMFLSIDSGDPIEWCIGKNHEVIVKRGTKNEK